MFTLNYRHIISVSGRRYEEKLRRKTRKNYLLNIVASGCYKNPKRSYQLRLRLFLIVGCPNERKRVCFFVIFQNVFDLQLVQKIFHTVIREFSREKSHNLLFCQCANRLQQRKNIIDCVFVNHCVCSP